MAELLRRFRRTIRFSAIGTFPTVAAFALVLWSESSAAGLIAWSLITAGNSVLWLANLRRRGNRYWLPSAVGLQITGGIAYGLLPLIAMPNTAMWQMFVAALTIGIMAANVLFASQVRALYYGFHAPHVLMSLAGFFLLADGPAVWATLLIAYAALFSGGLAEIDHLTNLSAAVYAMRSKALADGLESERAALALANRRLSAQARTDALTGLPNRLEFIDRLDQALVEDTDDTTTVAVAYVDLDGFKAVNDSMGHRAGDLLLVALANRLATRLIPGETLARIGGDEMVVMNPRLALGQLDRLGERLVSAFDSPIAVDGRPVPISASIGLADSSTSGSASDLLRFADTALYRSKAAGEGRAEVFDSELHRQLRHRMELEHHLEAGLANGELVPYLQPVVHMPSGQLMSAEALIRWERPCGLLTGGAFITIAAEMGLLEPITDLVIDSITTWRVIRGLGSAGGLPVAVNIDPRHLEHLLDRLEHTGMLTGLILEITEESSFASPQQANELIGRAHASGAKVVLDDFGVGFSSLARALELEVDGYKIDRSFVAPITHSSQARALVSGVNEMARQQDRVVVAEGVETMEQAQVLIDIGITLAQGFLYAPALPVNDLGEMLVMGHQFETPDVHHVNT